MIIVDIKKLAEDIRGLLDNETYSVKTERCRESEGDKVGIFIPDDEIYPIARVGYNGSNHRDIIIEESRAPPPFAGREKEYAKLLKQHRPRLQKMGEELEIGAQRKEGNLAVIYIDQVI